jgi:hypothetical protein
MEDPTEDAPEAGAPTPAVELPPIPGTIEEMVGQYVKLRDTLKEADDQHKKKTATARAYKEKLEGGLLAKLNEIGGENVKTGMGTVYRTTRRSAVIRDGDAFRSYVINNDEFDLIDWKANAGAVDDFIKSNSVPPPGVDFSTTFTVGVRRK